MFAWPWAKGALPNFGVSYNISVTAGARNFTFGTQLGFANAHHKSTPRGKKLGWMREFLKILSFPVIFLQRLGLASLNLARSWGLPRPIIKSHSEERVGVALG